jgi:hypothetical protein
MPFIIGNITLRSCPSEDDLEYGICTCCKEEARERVIDASFSDPFGNVEDWDTDGSECCGAQLAEGHIWLDKETTHVARKDHLNDDGKVVIAKGEKYRTHIIKGYWIDPDTGKRNGIYKYSKWKLSW